MGKKIVLIMIFLLVLAGTILFFDTSFFNENTAEDMIVWDYSYTKAICNEDNYCQDYEVVCKSGEIISQNPITGAAIQQALNWVDPRNEFEKKIIC